VVAFNTEKSISNILNSLNEKIDHIIFYALKEVKYDFNPRYAELRWYRYFLKNEEFDMDVLIDAASCFTGEHDFTNFARIENGRNPNRNINNIMINEHDDFISIDFFAQNFLWNQIRRIISTIRLLHKRRISINDIKKALDNSKVKVDFGLASSNNLILKNIFYNFEFNYDISKLKESEEIEKEVISRCLSF
jgi:tRNA pseudouridine38-40 synthase